MPTYGKAKKLTLFQESQYVGLQCVCACVFVCTRELEKHLNCWGTQLAKIQKVDALSLFFVCKVCDGIRCYVTIRGVCAILSHVDFNKLKELTFLRCCREISMAWRITFEGVKLFGLCREIFHGIQTKVSCNKLWY